MHAVCLIANIVNVQWDVNAVVNALKNYRIKRVVAQTERESTRRVLLAFQIVRCDDNVESKRLSM